MEQTIRERLIIYLTYKGLTRSKFQKSIGVSNAYIHNISKGIGVEKLNEIHAKYPDLNIAWLMHGDGDMIVDPSYEQKIEGSGNNTIVGDVSGNVEQNSNSGNSRNTSEAGLLKDIIKLKDIIAKMKHLAFKARKCPTTEEMIKILDELIEEE